MIGKRMCVSLVHAAFSSSLVIHSRLPDSNAGHLACVMSGDGAASLSQQRAASEQREVYTGPILNLSFPFTKVV